MNSKQLQLSVLMMSTFACTMQAANPLRTAPIAARVAARHVTQPTRVTRAAAHTPEYLQPRIASAAFASYKTKTPSLEECAQNLQRLCKERDRLKKEGFVNNDNLIKLHFAKMEMVQYKKPILEHLERKRNALQKSGADDLTIEGLIKMEVRFECDPARYADHLDELIKD